MKKIIKPLTILLTMTSLLTACGNGLESKVKALSSANSRDYECGVDCGEVFEVKPNKTASVLNHRQIVPSFQRCLGLSKNQISNRTKATVKESLTSLSKDSSADGVSAPMLLSMSKIIADLCMDLINIEKSSSNRKYFSGFNLGAGAGSQVYNFNNTIKSLASSCWGREAEDTEVTLITNILSEASLGQSKDIKSALFMCTTMLSSSAAVGF